MNREKEIGRVSLQDLMKRENFPRPLTCIPRSKGTIEISQDWGQKRVELQQCSNRKKWLIHRWQGKETANYIWETKMSLVDFLYHTSLLPP